MKARKVYLEILRIIAIFFVLYVHTGYDGLLHYTIAGSKGSYYLSVTMYCLGNICNMMFFMISGALLLRDSKEESIKTFLVKRILKMILIIIFASLMQYLISYWKEPTKGFDLPAILSGVYSTPMITPYWFLYSYLGFLVALPLLRGAVRQMKKSYYLYFLGLFVFARGILPIVERNTELGALRADLSILSMIIIYPIFGYFLEYVVWEDIYNKKNILLINLAALAALGWSVFEAQSTLTRFGKIYTMDGLILLVAIALYVDARALCTAVKLPRALNGILIFAGNGIFGVYLLEPQLRGDFHFIYEFLEPYIKWFPATVIWLTVAMIPGILFMNLCKFAAASMGKLTKKLTGKLSEVKN